MKENEVKLLLTHGFLKQVSVEPSHEGARSTSDSKGWQARINGELLSSARKPVRIFASLDSATEALQALGVASFAVMQSECVAPTKVIVERAKDKARINSEEPGWMAIVDGERLASVRRETRIFASLDTAADILMGQECPSFTVNCTVA